MKLVIHIGFHKTGTSSLQAFCRTNRSVLYKKGILFPTTGLTKFQLRSRASVEGGHRGLESVISNPYNNSAQHKLKAIQQEAGSANCNTVFVSSETFSHPNVNISEHLLAALRKYFSDVKVLVYLRRQDLWSNSFYREFICSPSQHESRPYDRFCEHYLPEWLDYRSRLEKWENIVGRDNLLVRSYDDRTHKNIVKDILQEIGAELTNHDLSVEYTNNPSLPMDLVPFVIELNQRIISHEQKAKTTQKVFDALSKSNFYTKVQPLASAWLEKSMPSYAEQNLNIATHYRLPAYEKFISVGDFISKPSTELSLPPSMLNQIMPNRVDKLPADLGGNEGSWGISCLSNERLAQTGAFIEYHLSIGAEKIIVFLDNPEDPIIEHSFDDRVLFIPCTKEFWKREIGEIPDSNYEKLRTVHHKGLAMLTGEFGMDWALNIDADELIWVQPTMTLRSLLKKVSSQCNQIILPPLEAIFVNESDSRLFGARYFKVAASPKFTLKKEWPLLTKVKAAAKHTMGRLIRKYPNILCRMVPIFSGIKGPIQVSSLLLKPNIQIRSWRKKDQLLYENAFPTAAPILREGFLGHSQGRIATANSVRLDRVGSHRHSSTLDRIIRSDTNSIACILHYDAVDYDAWYLKWHRRVFGDSDVLRIVEERKMQQDMFLAAAQAGKTRKLFKDLFFLPEEWLQTFLKRHLVVQIVPPGIEEISKKWQTIETESQQDETVSKAV